MKCNKWCKWYKELDCPYSKTGRHCKKYKLNLSMPRDIFLKLTNGLITEPKAWRLTKDRFIAEGRI